MVTSLTEKICKICNLPKPLNQYHKDKSRGDGLQSRCKPCRILERKPLKSRVEKQLNKPPTKPTHLPNNLKRCPKCDRYLDFSNFGNNSNALDKLKTYCKVCSNELNKIEAKKNRPKRSQAGNLWRLRNLERVKLACRERYKNNPDIRRVVSSKRRALKIGSGGSHTVGEWHWVKFVQNYTCLKCGRKEPEIKLTQDHIIPISKGGTDNIGNIQGLCGNCNSFKGTKFMDLRTNKKVKRAVPATVMTQTIPEKITQKGIDSIVTLAGNKGLDEIALATKSIKLYKKPLHDLTLTEGQAFYRELLKV